MNVNMAYDSLKKYFTGLDKSKDGDIAVHELDMNNIIKKVPDIDMGRVKVIASDVGLTVVADKSDAKDQNKTYAVFMQGDDVIESKNAKWDEVIDEMVVDKEVCAVEPMDEKKIVEEESNEVVDDLADSLGEDFKEEIADSLEDGPYTGSYKFEADGTEYYMFESEDDAESVAIEQVEEMVSDDASMFNLDFIKDYIYISDTDKRMIALDMSDAERERYQDLKDREHYNELFDGTDQEDEFEEIQKRIDELEDSEDEDAEEKIEALKSEIEKLADEVIENKESEYADDVESQLNDPIRYFVDEQGIYSLQDLLKANFIQIDYREAAEDAVSLDSWAHFLSNYDGNYETTKGGRVYFRA
jgi:hypothetical protein